MFKSTLTRKTKLYLAIITLLFLIISAVSAWRGLALLPASFQSAAWLVGLGLTLVFGLFWLVLEYSLVRFWPRHRDGGLSQRLLTAFLGGLIAGLTAFLLSTPAGLSRLTLELYAANVWSPDIFRLTWLQDGLWERPLTLPTGETAPFNLEIVAGEQPQAAHSEVWLIKATWPDGETIPLEAFTAEPGWRLSQVSWDDRPLSVWVTQGQTPTRLSWQGQASGPLTLLFARHNRAGQVIVRWNGSEQTVDLFAPDLAFSAVTLPAQQPVVWRTELPLSAIQAEEISLSLAPDPAGHYETGLQKLSLLGLPGRTVELSGAELLKSLQVKDGQPVLTPTGIQFNPDDPEIAPQIYLAVPGNNSVGRIAGVEGDWLRLIPPLENALLVLYVMSSVVVLLVALTRFFQPRLLTNLNRTILSLLIILLIAEVGPRFILPPAGRYYVWQPNLRKVFKPAPGVMPGIEGESHFIINSQGIRGDEFSPADDYRILAIGGSTTICLYLDQSEAWPQLVQTRLNERQPDRQVWVGNVGKSARGTREHVLQLKYLLPQYPKIDAVIMLIGFNDLNSSFRWGENNPYVESSLGSSQAVLERAFDILVEQDPFAPAYQQTIMWRIISKVNPSQVQVTAAADDIDVDDEAGLNYVERRKKRQQVPILDELPDLSERLAEYSRNINKIIDLAEANQVRLILMTQPFLYRTDLTPEEESLLWLGAGVGRNYYYSATAMATGLSLYNQKLLEICAQRQVECIDLAAAIPKALTNFYDDAHFNEAGARRVAQVVTDYLLSHPPFSSD